MTECPKRSGITSAEYAVLLALLVAVVIAAVQTLGTCVHDGMTRASASVRGSVTAAGGVPLTSGISLPPIGGSLGQSQGTDAESDEGSDPDEPDDEPGTAR
jgi:Flp pilus assembly pilin Flp